MIFWGIIVAIVILSIILAVKSAGHELSVPHEVSSLKIEKKKTPRGVILFLKKKIVHYSSKSS